jgi:hypothetical protein
MFLIQVREDDIATIRMTTAVLSIDRFEAGTN